jgi:metal-sulfur cluster biosynthetic enzyme
MISRDTVREVLRGVVDPELGVDVVDLGLVYSIEVHGGDVRVAMTMTIPACPMNAYLSEAAEAALWERLPDARSVRVDLVWEPPWDPAMMSEAARQHLGGGMTRPRATDDRVRRVHL